MTSLPVYAQRRQEVFQTLETSDQGLSPAEAGQRLDLYGKNVLAEAPTPPLWQKWVGSISHPMALLLWLAGFAALFSQNTSLGLLIFLVILTNASFSFWREYRAGQAVASLRHLLPAQARVLRAGCDTLVAASDIVPGELLILTEGDNIPADARVVEEYGLRVNNAVLTGDSLPARRQADASLRDGISEIERPNLVFAGTSVISGTGRAVVYATGMLTQFGRIANLTQAVKEAPSQLQQQMQRISQRLTIAALVIGMVVLAAALYDEKLPTNEAFILTIGIIVAVVPEGLAPTVTLTLAMAVQRLAQHKVLVKKLSMVETLGAVSVICTDKSGTLTQNQMTVRQIWVAGAQYDVSGIGYAPTGQVTLSKTSQKMASEGNAQDLQLFYRAALLCNNSRLVPPAAPAQIPPASQAAADGHWTSLGDQTEAALLTLAFKGGLDEQETLQSCPRLHEIPFDARRKRMSTIHRCNGSEIALVKGAPREVLQLCTHVLDHGQAVPLDNATRSQILAANDDYARSALRVLALAQRSLPQRVGAYTPEEVEQDLTFLGLAAMVDPPRPEVANAMQAFHEAGIRVTMITGDYGLTAASVARRTGMLTGPAARILTGADLDALSDAELQTLLDEQVIFARMAPEHKLRLVGAYQQRGEVVAVIGDGVNDTPALRKADVGFAMGVTATDVAREAADVILVGDDFSAAVRAIEEGRAVFDNLRKFSTYIFASNIPELAPFIFMELFNIPLALTVAQVLAIDLGTDLLPALALGMERPEPDVMQRQPRPRDQTLVDNRLALRAFAWLGSLETIFCYLGFFWVYHNNSIVDTLGRLLGTPLPFLLLPAATASTTYLLATTIFHAGVVTGQIGNAIACRSEKSHLHQLGWFSNPLLLAGIAVEIILILAMVYLPPLARLFGHAPLPLAAWIMLALYAPGIYFIERLRKMLFHRKLKKTVS
jgi:P-type Ca2+ transporter type 2C